MLGRGDKRQSVRRGMRRFLVPATVVGTLLAWPGGALAQAPCDSSAIDQYVECLPGGGGENSSGGKKPTNADLSSAVQADIQSEGGDDAELLQQVASSSLYGAPQKSLGGPGRGAPPIDRERLSAADPQADVSAGDAATAAVSAVQGGDAGRLVGLLVALFIVTAAALGAAAVRQRRRSGSS